MAKTKEELDPVQAVLAAIRAKAGKGAARLLSEGSDSDVDEVIPSGIDVLDHYVLGIGGWPVGRIVELFASEGDGKSSLLMQTMAGVQRESGVVCLDETEHALDSARATVFGCDTDRIILEQSDTLEDAFSWIETALDSAPKSKKGDPPFFVGLDSLAATPTIKEVKEGLLGKDAAMDRARIASKAMRILTPKVAQKRALMFVVNQTRTTMGGGWGSNKTTPGGAALKFHASVRMEMFSGKSIKAVVGGMEQHVGKQVTLMAVKTKIGGKPWAKAKVRLYYDTGWHNAWSTVWHAKDRKLIPKAALYTEETYVAALAALGWPRGFANSAAEAIGEVEDAESELLGDDLGDD